MGSPEIGKTILSSLLKEGVKIDSVVTRPDQPFGRGQTKRETPVKVLAKECSIKVFEPKNKEELTKTIKKIKPDICIVAAYGIIIPKEALEIPEMGMINFHPSLLPKYRGPSPITEAIINGDSITGVSIIKVSEKMDAGDILDKKIVPLTGNETNKDLSEKLAIIGAKMIVKIIHNTDRFFLKKEKQEDSFSTYTKIIKKEDGEINFKDQTASKIERMWRAYFPWPGTYFYWKNKKINLFEIKVGKKEKLKPGEIRLKNDRILIGTKKECISPNFIQIEGKKKLNGKELACGYKDFFQQK